MHARPPSQSSPASHLAGAGAQASLPLLRVPADVLRGDERSMRLEARAPHAIETVQAAGAAQALDADLFRLRNVYGAAAAWERRMDLAAARATARLPGLPSSHCAVDTLLGRDDKIGFEDYLNSACAAARRRRAQARARLHRHAPRSPLSSPASLCSAGAAAGSAKDWGERDGRARDGVVGQGCSLFPGRAPFKGARAAERRAGACVCDRS